MHRALNTLTLLLLARGALAGNPIDEYFDRPSPYRAAKMFAYCSAQYQAGAAIAKDVPAVAEQYQGVARGASTVGAFALWLERFKKVEDGTAIEDGINRDLKFFSAMVDDWAENYLDAYSARLAAANAAGNQSDATEVISEVSKSIEDCIARTNKMQAELVDSMREFTATM